MNFFETLEYIARKTYECKYLFQFICSCVIIATLRHETRDLGADIWAREHLGVVSCGREDIWALCHLGAKGRKGIWA